MYVVNTRVAENGRRLVKIREFLGRVVAHGVVPETPPCCSPETLLREKNDYVALRGGTVRQPLQTQQEALAAEEQANSEPEDEETSSKL